MKILLTAMPIEEQERFEHDPNCAYSLGLGYLASVLEREGHDVKVLFLNNYDYKKGEQIFTDTFKEYAPDILGFQLFSSTRVSTFDMMKKIHNQHPKLPIFLGGVHISIMYEQVVKKYPYAVGIIGEGEETIVELAKCIENNTPISNIKGIAYNDSGNVILTQPRELIQDLDSLPFPKHETYFENEPNRVIGHIISSRGCPFNCAFCCLKLISKRRVRKRSVESVVDEIVYLKNKYPRLAHIQFHDDTLLIDNKRVIEMCKLLVEKNLGLTFECSARVKPISAEMFEWMKKAGFTKIMFGLETGSQKLLDSIHKAITKEEVISLFKVLKHFDFLITTFLMCGFPGENDDTVDETIKFVQKFQRIKYSWIVGVGKLWVYPGTEIYDNMKAAGHIDDDYWLTDKPVPYYTVENSFEKLVEFEERIMNGVSLERINTFNGFRKHFLKVPFAVIKFFLKSPGHLKQFLPKWMHFLINVPEKAKRFIVKKVLKKG